MRAAVSGSPLPKSAASGPGGNLTPANSRPRGCQSRRCAIQASPEPGGGRRARTRPGRPLLSDRADRPGAAAAFGFLSPPLLSLTLMRWATSWAASMAAYGDDSSRSAFTFMPPVTRQRVSCERRAEGKGVSKRERSQAAAEAKAPPSGPRAVAAPRPSPPTKYHSPLRRPGFSMRRVVRPYPHPPRPIFPCIPCPTGR